MDKKKKNEQKKKQRKKTTCCPAVLLWPELQLIYTDDLGRHGGQWLF